MVNPKVQRLLEVDEVEGTWWVVNEGTWVRTLAEAIKDVQVHDELCVGREREPPSAAMLAQSVINMLAESGVEPGSHWEWANTYHNGEPDGSLLCEDAGRDFRIVLTAACELARQMPRTGPWIITSSAVTLGEEDVRYLKSLVEAAR